MPGSENLIYFRQIKQVSSISGESNNGVADQISISRFVLFLFRLELLSIHIIADFQNKSNPFDRIAFIFDEKKNYNL